MNTVPYSLRYLPTGSATGEVLHVLPYAIIPPPHISLPQAIQYGPRDHVFAFFDDMVRSKARVENGVATPIDSVEMYYGGNLKTPNDMNIFTRVDGGQLVKRWTRATGVVDVYDPEPPVAAPEVDTSEEPDSISIGDDNGIKVNLGAATMNVTSDTSFAVEVPVPLIPELTEEEQAIADKAAAIVNENFAELLEPEQELDPDSANTVAEDEVEEEVVEAPMPKTAKRKSTKVSATN